MIKYVSILLLVFAYINSLYSQTTYFNNKYSIANSNAGVAFNAIENSSGYLMVGGATSLISGNREINIIQTDFEGNVLFEKTYGDTI